MQPVSASDVPSKDGGEIPRPLTVEEIHHIVKKYGEAAKRAQGQLYTELANAFASEDIEILNIGDSKRARRIIDGTMEGRNILNILSLMGYLQ